jgi:flagellar motility protein MotE (MotC chaperone)
MPTDIYGLIGFLGAFILTLLGILKAWKWYIDAEVEKQKSKDAADLEKQKSKDALEIAKYNAEVAKQSADILTASQAVEIIKATQELRQEVTQIKVDNEDRNEKLTHAMDKLENNLRNFEDTFQKFLVLRLNQFEQTLIK